MKSSTLKIHALEKHSLAYRQWGTTGELVIFLHGMPVDSTMWESCANFLVERGFVAIAPELLGVGETSASLKENHSIEGQADLMLQHLDFIAAGRSFHLIAHDLGGGVAQVMAAKKRHLIKSLTLSNCFAFDSWPVKKVRPFVKLARLDFRVFNLFIPIVYRLLKKAVITGSNLTAADKKHSMLQFMDKSFSTNNRRKHFQKMIAAFDNRITQVYSPKLEDVDVPVLIAWGDKDLYHPLKVGERINEVCKNSTVVSFDGDHFHPINSEMLAQEFHKFFKSQFNNKNLEESALVA